MTKDKALHAFMNKFMEVVVGGAYKADNIYSYAYPSTAVPTDAKLPYMTYEVSDGEFMDGDIPIVVNMWFRTTSEAVPNKAVRDFRAYIEMNEMITCDEGFIWVKPGFPFSNAMQDDTDIYVKRRFINLFLEYLTRGEY